MKPSKQYIVRDKNNGMFIRVFNMGKWRPRIEHVSDPTLATVFKSLGGVKNSTATSFYTAKNGCRMLREWVEICYSDGSSIDTNKEAK